MIAMEPPTSFGANDVRSKKTDLFCAVHPVGPDDAVRGQYGVGRCSASLSATTATSPTSRQLHHRDLRCPQARHRQLALGRRALLSPHRQVPAGAHHRDRHPVPPGALRLVPRDPGRGAAAQLPDAAHPARRGLVDQLQRQAAGPGDRDRGRRDGLLVSRLFRAAHGRRLRDAALRLPDRRCHAVPARRHGRGGLACRAACPRCLGRTAARRLSELRGRQLRAEAADRLVARDGRAWLPIGAGLHRKSHG